jgi:hypothetical protein
MPTLHSRSRTTALSSALMLATALLLPGAHAQTMPDATPPVTDAPPAATAPDTTPPTVTAPAMPDTTTAAPATPSATPDQSSSKSKFRIGPTVGVYIPTDGKTRNRFGSDWLSLGLGFGPITAITTKGQLGFDLNLQYQQHSGNHILLIPLGIGYRVALTDTPGAKTVPYVGVTADAYVIDLKSNQDNVSGTHVTGGGAALIGVNFGDSANIEARYQFVSSSQGFDLSGLNLTAGYRF